MKLTSSARGRRAAVVILGALIVVLTDHPDRDVDTPIKTPNPWFFAERAFPHDVIRRADWHRAQLEARAMREHAQLRGGTTWIQRGPTNVGGRITDLAIDPQNSDIVYAGAAEGGVLKTTDGGQSWTPLFDDQPSLSVGAVAIDLLNPDVIYAGTGEVNPGGGSVAYGGTGLYRSNDAGASWVSLGLEETSAIGRVRIDPTDSDRIFVAAMGETWGTNPERGIYRTTDGGESWELVLFVADDTGAVDLIMRPDDPDVLFAAMWQRTRMSQIYSYGGLNCAVHRSDDGGDTWTVVGGGLPTPSAQGGRIGLSLCASQPDVMHFIYADRTGFFDGLYRSTDGGVTWTRTNDGGMSDVFSSFGWWFGNVRTHPQDPDIVFALGLSMYRTGNAGNFWSNVTGQMHVDQHALEFVNGPEAVGYAGNDGGVYKTTIGGSWTKLFDLPVTQFYRIALDAGNPNAVYGGAQDNGTNRTATGLTDDWTSIFGGDGFQPLIHPLDSNAIWAQAQFGNLWYSSNGGNNWTDARNGMSSGDRRNWNAPLVQDPVDPDQRYFGTNRVYRSTSPTNWQVISPDLTMGPHANQPGQVHGTLTTISISPQDTDVVWVGSDDGLVHVSTVGGGVANGDWTDVSASLPERWITSVRADPFDRETAFVTVSGFRWNEPLAHVFRTTDLGLTWEPIASNLPEAPVNDFKVDPIDPNRYFAATDVGVYETLTAGVHWTMLGADLPNVVVTSLALDGVSRTLYAGTYGRSIFSTELTTVDVAQTPSSITPGRLLAPSPNPMRSGGTSIGWEIEAAGRVTVDVISVSGRVVWSGSVNHTSGPGEIRWDGRDARGRTVAPGVYYLRARLDGQDVGGRTLVVRI